MPLQSSEHSTQISAHARSDAVVLRIQQHEMRRRAADRRVGRRETEVLELEVFAADFEAVIHSLSERGLIAEQAICPSRTALSVHRHIRFLMSPTVE
jgi:hypothetical protein